MSEIAVYVTLDAMGRGIETDHAEDEGVRASFTEEAFLRLIRNEPVVARPAVHAASDAPIADTAIEVVVAIEIDSPVYCAAVNDQVPTGGAVNIAVDLPGVVE